MTPIRVLVVDDAVDGRRLLGGILGADTGIVVTGSVDSGAAALDFLHRNRADIAVVDIHMQGMDGYEATRKIMETLPLPIVLCSSTDPAEVATAFKAFEAGAVAVVAKPDPRDAGFDRLAAELQRMVRLMSEVRVVRRWPRKAGQPKPAPPPVAQCAGVVGIGASTGGPPALQTILAGLPKDFALPILVVQHITHGFLPGLAEWLGQTTALQVQIAAHGVEPRSGHVYLAPDDYHLEVDANGRIRLTREAPENNLRPSVDRMFRSLAAHCGRNAVGVLLTGMGRDGARELRTLRDGGAHTIAQDHESSVVHGMPGAAIALDAAREILHVDHIADALCRVVRQQKAGPAP